MGDDPAFTPEDGGDQARRLGAHPAADDAPLRRLSPAAMIRRRRLQEAAQRAREEPGADLARSAAELGYADHAHLTRDFQTVLGIAPRAYRSEASG